MLTIFIYNSQITERFPNIGVFYTKWVDLWIKPLRISPEKKAHDNLSSREAPFGIVLSTLGLSPMFQCLYRFYTYIFMFTNKIRPYESNAEHCEKPYGTYKNNSVSFTYPMRCVKKTGFSFYKRINVRIQTKNQERTS